MVAIMPHVVAVAAAVQTRMLLQYPSMPQAGVGMRFKDYRRWSSDARDRCIAGRTWPRHQAPSFSSRNDASAPPTPFTSDARQDAQ